MQKNRFSSRKRDKFRALKWKNSVCHFQLHMNFKRLHLCYKALLGLLADGGKPHPYIWYLTTSNSCFDQDVYRLANCTDGGLCPRSRVSAPSAACAYQSLRFHFKALRLHLMYLHPNLIIPNPRVVDVSLLTITGLRACPSRPGVPAIAG